MKIPSVLLKILNGDGVVSARTLSAINKIENLYRQPVYFFPEYTDHSIKHVEEVLEVSLSLIPKSKLRSLSPNDISFLILSVALHDLAMIIHPKGLQYVLDLTWSPSNIYGTETAYSTLWSEYLMEVKRQSSDEWKLLIGDEVCVSKLVKNELEDLNEGERKIVGEFIRRHHGRMAFDIARNGFPICIGGREELLVDFDYDEKEIIGIIARSHTMNLRASFLPLQFLNTKEPYYQFGSNVVEIMALLRIADYLQIHKERTDLISIKMKSIKSAISIKEHETHLAIKDVHRMSRDPTVLYVKAMPKDASSFVKITGLLKDIQLELDITWAVLGEIYSVTNNASGILNLRRIESNLDDIVDFTAKVNYIPSLFKFQTNPSVLKLLVSPLYNHNPKYGIRELIQNSIDACVEMRLLISDYNPKLRLSIYSEAGQFYFVLEDNGKGMNVSEIKNYYLVAGSSLRESKEWRRDFTDEDGNSRITRTGKFGVGVLAAFLLGDELDVTTRSFREKDGLHFSSHLKNDIINVEKVTPTFPHGTIIRIGISYELYTKIADFFGSYEYLDWYFGDDVELDFFINSKQVNMKRRKELKGIPEDVFWQEYNDSNVTFRFSYFFKLINANLRSNLILNNFYIEGDASYLGEEHTRRSLPFTVIEDLQNTIGISLDRNRLYEHKYLGKANEFIDRDYLKCLSSWPIYNNGSEDTITIESFLLHFFHASIFWHSWDSDPAISDFIIGYDKIHLSSKAYFDLESIGKHKYYCTYYFLEKQFYTLAKVQNVVSSIFNVRSNSIIVKRILSHPDEASVVVVNESVLKFLPEWGNVEITNKRLEKDNRDSPFTPFKKIGSFVLMASKDFNSFKDEDFVKLLDSLSKILVSEEATFLEVLSIRTKKFEFSEALSEITNEDFKKKYFKSLINVHNKHELFENVELSLDWDTRRKEVARVFGFEIFNQKLMERIARVHKEMRYKEKASKPYRIV